MTTTKSENERKGLTLEISLGWLKQDCTTLDRLELKTTPRLLALFLTYVQNGPKPDIS